MVDSTIGFSVDPTAIEAELARLWKATTDQESGATRTRLANLIVEGDAVSEAVFAAFSPSFPSRTLWIKDPSSEGLQLGGSQGGDSQRDRVRASIRAVCHRPRGASSVVCGEEIVLSVPASKSTLVRGVVTPLLVADLPVILVAGRTNLVGDLASELGGLLDRVVFDSRSHISRLADVFSVVARSCDTSNAGRAVDVVEDIAWHAGASWRAVLRDVFETPEPREILGDLTELTIEGSSLATECLLVGWLAACLGWRLAGPATVQESDVGETILTAVFQRPGADGIAAASVSVRCVAAVPSTPSTPSSDGEPREVRALGMRVGDKDGAPFLAVRSCAGRDLLEVKYCTSQACILPESYPVRRADDAVLLGEVLSRGGDGELFRAALEVVRGLISSSQENA